MVYAAVGSVDPIRARISLTHRELLGTWLENASRFAPGETVSGIVRGNEDYGIFVELAPNLSGLTDVNDFSSPDGLAFSKSSGICWIQTDDGAYTDVSNCMMLAAVPGSVGDGGKKTLSYTKADGSKLDIVTPVGKAATADTLKRFLVGPKGCEITGLAETPDGKAIFVNIQHPGEATKMSDVGDPTKYQSQWPANAGYGAGKRPRSATIVITKNDGGMIGT
jgi:secreted PhoX family phosphatase